MFSRKTVPVHPEDEKILSIIRELCAQLNYYKLNIQSINWLNRMGIRRFPPDALLINPRFHTILLSTQAMGQLTPEEWRPLLASSLLYYKNHNRGMLKTLLPMFSLVLLMPFVLLADFTFLNSQSPIIYDGVIIVLIIFVILSYLVSMNLMKKFYLKMDDKAAQFLGKDALLASLTKLDMIKGGSPGRRGFIRPSLQERIRHLQTVL